MISLPTCRAAIAAAVLFASTIFACVGPPAAAVAVSVGLAGCQASPPQQAAAIDATIAGYERSVMRLHQAGLLDDDELVQAHTYAVASREALSVFETSTGAEQKTALDIAEAKLADLSSILLHAGGEPPGPPPGTPTGIFGY